MRNRYAALWVPLLIAGGALALPAGRAPAADPTAPAADAAQPAQPAGGPTEISALIGQLGSDDYARREAAAKRLRAIGKPALPALNEATQHDDAEIASRAQALVKRIAVRPLPKGVPGGANALMGRARMQVTAGDDDSRVIRVTEGGREVEIREGPDGITMNVRGLVDGQPGSEEYTAGSAEQLKEDNPEAYEVYARWTGAVGPDVIFRGRFGNRVVLNGGLLLPPVPDEIDQLRTRLAAQMAEKKLKEADRETVAGALDKLAEARLDLVGGMEKYSDQCDALRKTLEQLKLDPGELLPPPARTRLGVSISTGEGRMFVQKVGENSRAARIGIQPGDLIRRVDGQDVENVGELRKLVGAKEQGLVVEITRAGEDMKLVEPAPATTKPAK
jgi:hypothetical protein